jgi:hypothetical protein
MVDITAAAAAPNRRYTTPIHDRAERAVIGY